MNEQRQRVIDEIKAEDDIDGDSTIIACAGEPFCSLSDVEAAKLQCSPESCPLCQIEQYDEGTGAWVMVRRAPYLH